MSSSSASASAGTPTPQVGSLQPGDYKPAQTDINLVVFDFLVTEGFPRAAELFAKEANLQRRIPDVAIQERMNIRKLIHAGDLQGAIGRINDISPEVLDKSPSLHFALLRLQLIELIRKYINEDEVDLRAVIMFARDHVAPLATSNPMFLKDLESAMSLTIIHGLDRDKYPALLQHQDDLLSPVLRREVAARVNEALLSYYHQYEQSQLRELVRLRSWAENEIRTSGKEVPEWDGGDVGSQDDVEAMDTA